jgi:arginase family enzyme
LDFAIVGCSLDALDAEDKLAMKLAYLYALREGVVEEALARDPYELMVGPLSGLPGVSVAGALAIESWLTPRPSPSDVDFIEPVVYREFLGTDGCTVIAARLREFVKSRVLPLRPLLVGVDHSLTAGVVEALAGSGARPALVVLDSHFDAVPTEVRRAALGPGAIGAGEAGTVAAGTVGEGGPETAQAVEAEPQAGCNCGTWLGAVLDKGLVGPEDIVVIGVSDHPGYEATDGEPEGTALFRDSYLSFEERGVTVLTKRKLRETGVEKALDEALDGLEGRQVYVSVDADIGSGAEVKAVRFLDTLGLSIDEVVRVTRSVRARLAGSGCELTGFDIMEVDVHLADIPHSGDRTVEMCLAVARELVGP